MCSHGNSQPWELASHGLSCSHGARLLLFIIRASWDLMCGICGMLQPWNAIPYPQWSHCWPWLNPAWLVRLPRLLGCRDHWPCCDRPGFRFGTGSAGAGRCELMLCAQPGLAWPPWCADHWPNGCAVLGCCVAWLNPAWLGRGMAVAASASRSKTADIWCAAIRMRGRCSDGWRAAVGL
jgi:hypothetical protein